MDAATHIRLYTLKRSKQKTENLYINLTNLSKIIQILKIHQLLLELKENIYKNVYVNFKARF